MERKEIIEILMAYLKSEVKNNANQKDDKIFITLKNKIACISVQPIKEN